MSMRQRVLVPPDPIPFDLQLHLVPLKQSPSNCSCTLQDQRTACVSTQSSIHGSVHSRGYTEGQASLSVLHDLLS